MQVEPPPEPPPPLLPEAELWAAVHTHARAEKITADYLRVKAVPHYLPMTQSRRIYGARVRESWIPLFPGYLFYDAAAVDRRVVYACGKVAKILVPDDGMELKEDLLNLAALLVRKPDVARTQIDRPGTPVEVISGPFAGTHGELIRRKGKTMLVILVRFIGYGAEMAIDEACVRPVNEEVRGA